MYKLSFYLFGKKIESEVNDLEQLLKDVKVFVENDIEVIITPLKEKNP